MKQFVIDGEAVILGVDGRSDFDALHSGKHNEEVQLYAFDMLAGDGDDMRQLPLSMRKANLARLLAVAVRASSSPHSKKARSAPTCFGPPAEWGWKVWFRRTRPSLSRGSVAILGENQEPQTSRDGPWSH